MNKLGILKAIFSRGEYRQPKGWLASAITVMAVLITVYGIWSNTVAAIYPYVKSAVFLGCMIALTLILYTPTAKSKATQPGIIDYISALLSLAAAVYVFFQSERLINRFPTVDPMTPADWFFGIVMIVLAIEVTRRIFGIGLTSIVILFVFYSLFGHLLPGQLYHRPVGLSFFVDSLALTENGINGSIAVVAASYVFMFVGFGVFLDKANGGKFFSGLANSIAGHRIGGPAKISIISSALYGTISGSPTADVMTTGSFSIPLMKKTGFKPAFAGAVEAVSSTGGALLPPIMGSAAFLMVELTGTPYRDLVIAAFVPALLYFFGVYMQIHYFCCREGMAGLPKEQLPKLIDTLKNTGEFILPFFVLVYLLLSGYTPAFTAISGTVTIIVVSWFRRANRMGLRDIIKTLDLLIRRLAPLTAACAAAGLVVAGITVTGFAGRMLALINLIAGDSLLIALLIAAAVCIIMGMGMPIPAVYVLTSVLVAPALIDRGVSMMAAHLFLIYFSAMSAITPPIAVAAYAASTIAEADPMEIGWTAVRLGAVAFLVPFMFVYDEALLLNGSALWVLWSILVTVIGIMSIAMGSGGYMLKPLNFAKRIILVLAGLSMIIPGTYTDLAGIGIMVLVLLSQMKGRQVKTMQDVSKT